MYIFFFLLGAACASFLNVLVGGGGTIRENLSRKRSRCESCKKPLRWWELVPVISWIALGGRCARCKTRIPPLHPVSELLLGMAFASVFLMYSNEPLEVLWQIIFVLILYFFSMYDLMYGVVPGRYLHPLIVLAGSVLVGRFCLGGITVSELARYAGTALGGYVFFVLVNSVSRSGVIPGVAAGKDGFGGGDAWYALFLGLGLGWPTAVLGLWIGIILGAICGVAILLKSKGKEHVMPFIPFMSLGAWVAMLWGDGIMEQVRLWIMY